MSDQGVVDAGEATQAEEASPSASEIFQAEVKALEDAEAGGAQKASDFIRVNGDAGNLDSQGEQPAAEGEPTAEGGEQPEASAEAEPKAEQPDGSGEESQASEEGQESDESSDDTGKRKRRSYKQEAEEANKALLELRAELAEIKQAVQKPAPEVKPEEKSESFEPPKVDLEKLELSQELKDLLEYTPGLDKMVTSLAAETAKAIIEKDKEDRTRQEQEQQTAQQREEQDRQYWTGVDSWLQGQYPELSLSDIRNSPDFADWTNYHQSWVNSQLSSSNYDDPSGAQKVFERYIKEQNLATKKEPEPETDSRNLAAARTPAANRRTAPPTTDRRSLFQQEAQRLNSNQTRYRTTI